jgi:hypothetical protein
MLKFILLKFLKIFSSNFTTHFIFKNTSYNFFKDKIYSLNLFQIYSHFPMIYYQFN